MSDGFDWSSGRHVRPLDRFVAAINSQGLGTAPGFDPLDGGTNARLMLLLEKPGRRVAGSASPSFVSRDNPTPTARTVREGMQVADIARRETILWNAVPWWNGTMRVSAREKQVGAEALRSLLPLLPRLRCVVLAGRTAQDHARAVCEAAGLHVFTCVHPSPNARAGPASAEAWTALPEVWRQAWLSTNRSDPQNGRG